ncbi:MAG: hypothetical protein KI792_10290 [Alphaproteobacteria bacterium]|nr:hypothetical protein [Alphaproteobacteria bacterium SS10]
MYALLIALVVAAFYLSLSNPFQAKSPGDAPLVYEKPHDAYSHGLGRDMARFVASVESALSTYAIDQRTWPIPGPPIALAQTEIAAELADPGNPSAGYWVMDVADFETFLTNSDYADAAVTDPAFLGPADPVRRFLPTNYTADGPWRVAVIEQVDALGAGTGEVAAIIGFVENVPRTPGGQNFLETVSVDDFAKGFRRAFNGTVNFGINDGGTLTRRGVEHIQLARSFDLQNPPDDAMDHGTLDANEISAIVNIPLVDRGGNNLIPDGVPVYVVCKKADDVLGADGLPGTGDEFDDGFCD